MLMACLLVVAACSGGDADTTSTGGTPSTGGSSTSPSATEATTSTTTTTTLPERPEGLVPGWTVGLPWGEVEGLLMFRGNPTRTYYGEGPVPQSPEVLWRFPDSAMCGNSPVGGEDKVWCGSGWTGQPLVWERPDGITEVIFGAYDKRIHFVDAATGERTRPDFNMGDIIKGTPTLDPDGFPLVYSGSRSSRFRVVAIDRADPTELWGLEASAVDGIWNNDWDSNPVIVDDYLYVGGENSWFFIIKLNRGYDAAGMVTVDPQLVFSMPAWTDELRNAIGNDQSVENSPAVFENRVYFANSAGRVVGLDVSDIAAGNVSIVFDFWTGDDTDATIVIDEDGMLYVSSHSDHDTARSAELGYFMKLDPYQPEDPVVWSIPLPNSGGVAGGIWATPALFGDVIYVPANTGELIGVDIATGETVWFDSVGTHAWSSPVVVDDTLVLAVGCESQPAIRAYDVANPRQPVELWELPRESACIESTVTIWKGRMFVGSRDGFFYAFGD
jgi:outer membrane protein assembly factor BamB